MSDTDQKSAWDKANDGVGGVNQDVTAINGMRMGYNNLMATDPITGLPAGSFGANDMLRPFGLNYDAPPGSAASTAAAPGADAAGAGAAAEAPANVGESAAGFTPDEEAFFNGASNPEAVEAGEAGAQTAEEATAAAESAEASENLIGGAAGVAGLVGGGLQFKSGMDRAFKDGAKEQDEVHGGLDMAGGAAGVVGGGLGLATALGAGGAVAGASAVAAPVAAAIGLGVAGDHRAEDMHLFGKDADGNYQGAVEAAWNEGQHLGDETSDALGGGTLGTVGGATVAGLSTVGLEAGAAVADVGLGIDGLGASSGLFGTAANADGKGTHNMGAFEALDHAGQAAGSGVDNLLGLDQDSTAGAIVGGATEGIVDAAGSGLALAADVGGAVVGGVEALGSWVGDWF